MTPTLNDADLQPITETLRTANQAFLRQYPGESPRRQPIHVVYGGAHLFKADSAQKLGALALRSLEEFAPDSDVLNEALEIPWARVFASTIYERIVSKLQREPTEDFRLDFEDGYGNRADAEEDGHAISSAGEVAAGLQAGTLPPFLGIRVKPLNEDLRARSLRTLDLFITALVEKSGGQLPPNFVITLPKVQLAAHVTAATQVCTALERKLRLAERALRLELMVETPQAILDREGRCPLLGFIDAAEGRCGSVHFGVYDYTASVGITAAYQAMGHSACDFARTMMIVALAGTGVQLSDGATNVLPVGPYRGPDLSDEQVRENRHAVHAAWRRGYLDNLHSLRNGLYQGWDLHPAQLVVRYAAVYSFFRSGLALATSRLHAFMGKAALASLHGDVFDDAATGQGLLNFFLRGIACSAIEESEALETGLTLAELRSRSFFQILQGRRG